MKRGKFTVLQNKELAPATFRMVLAGDTEAITAPGQFVNIALTGKFLRRPISVCDWNEAQLTLIYKVVGQGTAQMSQMVPGTELDLLTGLGNGYDLEKSGDKLGFRRCMPWPKSSLHRANRLGLFWGSTGKRNNF